MSGAEALQHGRQAFQAQKWAEAYALLAAADQAAPLDADDLLQLALASILTGRDDEGGAVLARAHEQFLARGQLTRAAQCAIWLGMALLNALDGMPFPAPDFAFSTKDEMADYLVAYAPKFELPVKTGVRVERLSRQGKRFHLQATDGQTFEADHVVVAMANYQRARVPEFAAQLSPHITQVHSTAYRNPDQLQPGPVLVVGLGNSGAEIALEVARTHKTYVSGRDPGSIPFRIDGLASHLFLSQVVFRGVFHRLLTVDTPIGRRAQAQSHGHTTPLIRVLPSHLHAAGVERPVRTRRRPRPRRGLAGDRRRCGRLRW